MVAELATVGDIDNAVTSLTFASGKLGVVDLSRSGIYGYDISTELLGNEGTIRIGYIRETPILSMTKNSISHDTVPYFMERFERAYALQLQNFAQNVLNGREPSITIRDGVEALRVAQAQYSAIQSISSAGKKKMRPADFTTNLSRYFREGWMVLSSLWSVLLTASTFLFCISLLAL